MIIGLFLTSLCLVKTEASGLSRLVSSNKPYALAIGYDKLWKYQSSGDMDLLGTIPGDCSVIGADSTGNPIFWNSRSISSLNRNKIFRDNSHSILGLWEETLLTLNSPNIVTIQNGPYVQKTFHLPSGFNPICTAFDAKRGQIAMIMCSAAGKEINRICHFKPPYYRPQFIDLGQWAPLASIDFSDKGDIVATVVERKLLTNGAPLNKISILSISSSNHRAVKGTQSIEISPFNQIMVALRGKGAFALLVAQNRILTIKE